MPRRVAVHCVGSFSRLTNLNFELFAAQHWRPGLLRLLMAAHASLEDESRLARLEMGMEEERHDGSMEVRLKRHGMTGSEME